jgi:hypothetical protein
MSDKESLKAKRHQLYCSIADALQHTSAENSSGILGRLQAVLEAEASLSCIDGDEGESVLQEPASNTFDSFMMGSAAAGQAAAATAAAWHTRGATSHQSTGLAEAAAPRLIEQARSAQHLSGPSTSGLAMSALHNLKQELAQRVQHSMQKPRQGKVSSAATGLHMQCLLLHTGHGYDRWLCAIVQSQALT